MTCIVVLFTMVATTYAWVGILTYSSIEGFDMNIKVENANQAYSLKISTDGVNYSESVSLDEIQKQVLTNMGIDYESQLSETSPETIDRLFNKVAILEPVTTSINTSTQALDKFYSMKGKKNPSFDESHKFFKFDVYLIVEPREGIQDSTNLSANLFISDIENTILGTICTDSLINGNPFASTPSEEMLYPLLKDIPQVFSINSASAARMALSIYNPINKNDNYTEKSTIQKTLIYQGGTTVPSKNSNNVYSLGGILPEEYNIAIREYNSLYNADLSIDSVSAERLNDLELVSENRTLFTKPNRIDSENYNYFGVSNGVPTKLKISVYFWFEGWDADCLQFLEKKQITLNLKFSTDIEES